MSLQDPDGINELAVEFRERDLAEALRRERRAAMERTQQAVRAREAAAHAREQEHAARQHHELMERSVSSSRAAAGMFIASRAAL